MTGPDDRGALDSIADDVTPDVLAAALEQARERATARLADLLTDAIVDRALRGTPKQQPVVDTGSGDTGSGRALYAYAVTRADLSYPDDGPGLTDGRPVELVTADDLGLLVSRVDPAELTVDPEDLSETGRLAVLARGHDTVVRAAGGVGPVLPLRFGTVVADEDGARRLLRTHAHTARELLDRIGDAREWGIRLVRTLTLTDQDPVLAGARRDRDDLTGTQFLARRRQATREREDATRGARAAAETLETALAPHTTDRLRRGGATGSSLLLDLAYLVPAAEEEAFLAEVERLTAELTSDGLTLEVTGPWPPYSFAALTVGGTDGA